MVMLSLAPAHGPLSPGLGEEVAGEGGTKETGIEMKAGVDFVVDEVVEDTVVEETMIGEDTVVEETMIEPKPTEKPGTSHNILKMFLEKTNSFYRCVL